MKVPTPSVRRIIRRIKAHQAAILRHRDELVKLRADLEYVEAFADGAHRNLQQAINELCRIE